MIDQVKTALSMQNNDCLRVYSQGKLLPARSQEQLQKAGIEANHTLTVESAPLLGGSKVKQIKTGKKGSEGDEEAAQQQPEESK